MKELRGKRVLITGGARGIGRAMADRFAREGCEIALSDMDGAALDAAAKEMTGAGARVSSHVCDVTDPTAVERLRGEVHAAGGPVDVLVNNAGIVFGGSFLDVPLARHHLIYAVNVLGVVNVTHAFLPDLIGRPEAHLVNVASASGLIGLPFGATYASSKWAVIGFSDSIRLELEMLGHGHVKVTSVCPSYVATGLFDGAKPPMMTRMLTPERLADLVRDAVRYQRADILTPWLVRLTPPLKTLLPRRMFEALSWWTGATSSMKQWRGHVGAPPPPKGD